MHAAVGRAPTRREACLTALLGACASTSWTQVRTLTFARLALGGVVAMSNVPLWPIADEAARRCGLAIRYVPMPPLRSLDAIDTGEIDGEVARIAEAVALYPNLVAVPTPMALAVLTVYAATPDIEQATRAQIRAMRIGVLRGQLQARKHTEGLQKIEASVPTALFELLATGRCDAVIMDHFEAAPYLQLPEPPRIYRWRYAWASDPLHMVLNRRHIDLVASLDAALQQMTRDGYTERVYSAELRALHVGLPPPNEPPAAR